MRFSRFWLISSLNAASPHSACCTRDVPDALDMHWGRKVYVNAEAAESAQCMFCDLGLQICQVADEQMRLEKHRGLTLKFQCLEAGPHFQQHPMNFLPAL